MRKIVISVLLSSLLAACASEKPKEPAVAVKSASVAEAPKPAASAEAASITVDPLNDPNSILAKRSVYYPFDISVVQDADKPIVVAHAKYLGEHANRKVRLEGNCDERGSDEYNLALGQHRADSVKKLLLLGGAKASQIETISYGENKPKLACHEEKCWKENRRTDLNYNVQ